MKKFKNANSHPRKLNKKILLFVASTIMVIAFVAIGISSCSRASYYQLALDNLSEARFYMKQDKTDTLKVQFFTGMRENPYNMDGLSETTTAFGILNVDPANNKLLEKHELSGLTGTLKIGDELVDVTLIKNPYDKNYACDIARLVDVSKTISFTLNLENEVIVFNLENCMGESSIDWERALEIATDHLTDQIKEAGKFECYVKIIHDVVQNTGSYWYMQFVPQEGNSFFCVIDPTGNVIS